jgi:holliday junction DNA helicase RuvB
MSVTPPTATSASLNEIPPIADWSEYRGQEQLKNRLMVHARAALTQGRMLDDMLFVAPPGAGKTTLATLLATEVKDPFHLFMMPTDPQEFCRFCRRWEGGIILLDEIHSAPNKFQELLYPAIGQENKMLHPPSGAAVDVNHITFIAATTEPHKVLAPLYGRFKLKPRWDDYSVEEMTQIVADAAKRIGMALPAGVAEGLAGATGGTPRLAGALVAAARDLSVIGNEVTVQSVLDLVGIDEDGLTQGHVDYLKTLDTLNGTSGLKNICTLLQLSTAAVEEVERQLLQQGFITVERHGRCLTELGERKVGIKQRPSLHERRAS